MAAVFEKELDVFGVTVDVTFESTPGYPAKISGPPENCYEGSGPEVNVLEVSLGGYEISDIISEDAKMKIQALCEEASPEMHESEREQAMCDAAEARAEARADLEREWSTY
jgi:hypothetical protein